jgi:flagellar basal-body rod modification protein FlgD
MSVISPVFKNYQTTQPAQPDQAEQADAAQEIQDSFLKMLIAQLQYQDPLNPIENSEFTAQLAQINTVQQLEGLNKNMGYQQLYLASINNSQSIEFIGKEVLASGDTIYYDGANKPDIQYTLNGSAASVAVSIFDQNNQLISTIRCGSQRAGAQTITWDGYDKNGNQMTAGPYRYSVQAVDLEGTPVDSTKMLTGRVDGVTFQDGVTYVTVHGQKIPIGDIIQIQENTSAGSSAQSNVDLIGRNVTARGDRVYFDGTSSPVMTYNLGDSAQRVLIRVYDSSNTLVRSIESGPHNRGDRSAIWDGLDNSGNPVPTGEYSFTINAYDAQGVGINAQSIITGRVDQITYDAGGTAYAVIGGVMVPVDAITEIKNQSGAVSSMAGALHNIGSSALRLGSYLL